MLEGPSFAVCSAMLCSLHSNNTTPPPNPPVSSSQLCNRHRSHTHARTAGEAVAAVARSSRTAVRQMQGASGGGGRQQHASTSTSSSGNSSTQTSSSSSSSTQQRQRRQQQRVVESRGRRVAAACRPLLLAALAAVLALQVGAVNIVFDETGWTKTEWHKYKIDYSLDAAPSPLDDLLKAAPGIRKALSAASLSSILGPSTRKPVNRLDSLWAREDGSLAQAPADDSAVDAAAEAIQCTACHALVSHTWQQLVAAVNSGEPINELSVKDVMEEACEAVVPSKLMAKYRIVQVEAPEVGVSLFVVRDRPGSGSANPPTPAPAPSPAAAAAASKQPPVPAAGDSSGSGSGGTAAAADVPAMHPDATAAEVAAAHKACMDLVLHHSALLQRQLWARTKDYFAERTALGRKVLSKLKLDDEDPDLYEVPEEDSPYAGEDEAEYAAAALDALTPAQLVAPENLCLDLDIMCPYWASRGQCTANPKYMQGGPKHAGHCRRSCGLCKPSNEKWDSHMLARGQLSKSVAAAATQLRSAACTASKACLAGGASTTAGGAAAMMVDGGGALLPGALLAKTPGFVLGKPFWAVPKVSVDPTGGLPDPPTGVPAAAAAATPAGGSTRGSTGAAGAGAGAPAPTPAAAAGAKARHPADETLLSAGLGHKLLTIPGMDAFFMYQLEYKRRVYQFHKDDKGKVTEEHVLGRYDSAATEAAAARHELAGLSEAGKVWQRQWALEQDALKKSSSRTSSIDAAAAKALKAKQAAKAGDGDTAATAAAAAAAPHPPPMLDLLDYLPDTESMLASWWPYMSQLYTEGEACQVSGRAVERQVELRAACSPDADLHLLVREPEFCRYIMVLYHPHLCKVRELKPVSVLTALEVLASTSKAGSKVGAGSGSSTAAGTRDAGSASAVHEDSGGGGEDEDEAAGSGTRHTAASLRATDGGRGGRGSSGGSELPKKRVTTSGPSGAGHDESGDEQQQQQQPGTKGKLSTS